MGGYQVDRDALLALVSTLREEAAGIDDELNRLDAEVAALRDRWNGAAQESYDAAHLKWTASMRDLHALLLRIATTAEKSHAAYHDAYLKMNAGLL